MVSILLQICAALHVDFLLYASSPSTPKINDNYKNNMIGIKPIATNHTVMVLLLIILWYSVRMRAEPQSLSLPGHSGSAVEGGLVSWERELQPSPDAEALPGDSILRPDGGSVV